MSDTKRATELIDEAYDLLIEARGHLDRGSSEWEYVQGAAAQAESAQILLGGPEVLEADTDRQRGVRDDE